MYFEKGPSGIDDPNLNCIYYISKKKEKENVQCVVKNFNQTLWLIKLRTKYQKKKRTYYITYIVLFNYLFRLERR